MGIRDRDYYREALKEREKPSRLGYWLFKFRIPAVVIGGVIGGLIGLAGAIIEKHYFR